MTSAELVVLLLGSSVLSSLLVVIGQWFFSRQSYRDDYYKIIIEKRLEAYEYLEEVVAGLRIVVFDEEDHKKYHGFCSSKKGFDNLMVKTGGVKLRATWLSQDLSLLTTEFNVFLLNKFTPKLDASLPKEELKKLLVGLGKVNYDEVGLFRDRFEAAIQADITSLFKVRQFLRSKREIRTASFPIFR